MRRTERQEARWLLVVVASLALTRWQYTFEPPQVKVKLLDAVRLEPR
ncbi:MAG: hypothetical protein IT380_12845 [Myxococcales bacterium]|nr:hypothetical protein [Myxococcales bacterium]